MVHPVRPRRDRAGFTLVELMIVVALIMVVSALVAPSLTEIAADNRQASAAVDLVRLSRGARALTMRSRATHMLRFREAESGQLGTIEMWAGMNNRCALTLWDTQAFSFAPVELFDMAEFNPNSDSSAATASDTGRQVILLRAQYPLGTARTEVRICYQPNGQTYIGTTPGTLSPLNVQTQSAVFTVRRTVPGGGGGRGVARQVLFPPGGTARLR